MARNPKTGAKMKPLASPARVEARKAPSKTPSSKNAPSKNAPSKNAPSKSVSSAQAQSPIDPKLVRDIADLLSGNDISEIEVSKGDLRIRVARKVRFVASQPSTPLTMSAATMLAPETPQPANMTPPAASPAPTRGSALKSPMVGTVYLRPGPDSKPFVEVGDHVKEGDKVLLVEAMKTFNEILAHRTGTVSAVLVDDGEPVEYDQALLTIE